MKRYLSLLLAVIILLGSFSISISADSTPSSWAQDGVDAAIDMGIVPEELQNNYSDPISRLDVAKMIILTVEKQMQKKASDILSDTNVDIDYYAFTDTNDEYVLYANSLGIIKGYKQEDGTFMFKPEKTLQRCEMAVILNRIANIVGVDTSGHEDVAIFDDTQNHWCKKELGWPVFANIINGVGGGKFNPSGLLTKEQAILLFYRTLNYFEFYEGTKLLDETDDESSIRQSLIGTWKGQTSEGTYFMITFTTDGKFEEFAADSEVEEEMTRVQHVTGRFKANSYTIIFTYDFVSTIKYGAAGAYVSPEDDTQSKSLYIVDDESIRINETDFTKTNDSTLAESVKRKMDLNPHKGEIAFDYLVNMAKTFGEKDSSGTYSLKIMDSYNIELESLSQSHDIYIKYSPKDDTIDIADLFTIESPDFDGKAIIYGVITLPRYSIEDCRCTLIVSSTAGGILYIKTGEYTVASNINGGIVYIKPGEYTADSRIDFSYYVGNDNYRYKLQKYSNTVFNVILFFAGRCLAIKGYTLADIGFEKFEFAD